MFILINNCFSHCISSQKEFHIDRGDAQRAAEYYAELAVKKNLRRECRVSFFCLVFWCGMAQTKRMGT
jgi:hypothetical protein